LLPISHSPKREVKPSRELFLRQVQLRATRGTVGGFFGLSLNLVILSFFMRLRSPCGYDADDDAEVPSDVTGDQRMEAPASNPAGHYLNTGGAMATTWACYEAVPPAKPCGYSPNARLLCFGSDRTDETGDEQSLPRSHRCGYWRPDRAPPHFRSPDAISFRNRKHRGMAIVER